MVRKIYTIRAKIDIHASEIWKCQMDTPLRKTTGYTYDAISLFSALNCNTTTCPHMDMWKNSYL